MDWAYVWFFVPPFLVVIPGCGIIIDGVSIPDRLRFPGEIPPSSKVQGSKPHFRGYAYAYVVQETSSTHTADQEKVGKTKKKDSDKGGISLWETLSQKDRLAQFVGLLTQ